jgi:hypothetical protein
VALGWDWRDPTHSPKCGEWMGHIRVADDSALGCRYTTAFFAITVRYHSALSLGIRFWVE